MRSAFLAVFSSSLLTCALNFQPATAADGSLDASFGESGKVKALIGESASAGAITVLPDGKILVAGVTSLESTIPYWSSFFQTRYQTNGSLDTTYGDNGVALGFAWIRLGLADMAVQSDGKVLTAGKMWRRMSSSQTGECENFDVVIRRTDELGFADETFGSDIGYGAGTVVNFFGCARDTANAIALQTDGKIVIGGSTEASGSNDDPDQCLVARYLEDGSFDETFGDQGVVVSSIGPSDCVFNDIAIQSDGAIVAVGRSRSGEAYDQLATLVRYTSAGTLDSSFGNGGVVTTDLGSDFFELRSLALQSDGKIVVAGQYGSGSVVSRYNTDGSLDTGFGENGFYFSAMQIPGISVLPDNKILLKGYSSAFDAERLSSSGELDEGFDAELTSGIPWADSAIQEDGKFLLAGADGDELAVARYLNTISKPAFDPAVILMLLNRPQICECENDDCDC